MYPQQVIDALRHVRYPGTGKDLIESGMLEDDIRISGFEVSFSLIFQKDNDPFMKSVVKAAEVHVREGVKRPQHITPNERLARSVEATREAIRARRFVGRHVIPACPENLFSHYIVLAYKMHLDIASHITACIPYSCKSRFLRIAWEITHKISLQYVVLF